MNELEKAAREALDALQKIEIEKGVDAVVVIKSDPVGIVDNILSARTALLSVLPQEYRCRDCNSTSLVIDEIYSLAESSFSEPAYQAKCTTCRQRGRAMLSVSDALKAAAGVRDERT